MKTIWSFIEKIVIAIFAPPTPMEPISINPPPSVLKPVSEAPSALTTPFTVIPWDTQKHCWHNTRVLCDLAGLTLDEKNLICACIYVESAFMNYRPNGSPMTHANVVNGKVTSTDWGLIQCNDFYNVGIGKPFPSVSYLMDNPDKAVSWMIKCYQRGLLKLWVSYTSGLYKANLLPNAEMWHLAD